MFQAQGRGRNRSGAGIGIGDGWILALLVALAIGARVATIWGLQSHSTPRSTYEHGEIAVNLLNGKGFWFRFLGAEGPTSQQAPLYPAILAMIYAIGGPETPRSLLVLQLGQAVLGGVLTAGVWLLARDVQPGCRGRAAAAMAGALTALHPTLVYAATHVQVALLAATLLVWTFAFAYRAARTRRIGDAAATGATLAALCLTDPILGLAAPGIAAALAIRRGWRAAARPFAIIAGVAVLGVAPWIARNAWVHGEFVFIKSTFGYAFWQGNCRLSEGTDKVVRSSVDRVLQASSQTSGSLADWNRALWSARHEAGYLDDIALTKADYRRLGLVSEPERSRILFRRALEDLAADPWRYPRLCLRRLRFFILFDETNPKTRSLVYRAGHLGLTILAAIGWLAASRSARRRMAPTLLTAGLIALFHSLTIVSARFHVPLEPLMALWAGSIAARLSWTLSAARANGNDPAALSDV